MMSLRPVRVRACRQRTKGGLISKKVISFQRRTLYVDSRGYIDPGEIEWKGAGLGRRRLRRRQSDGGLQVSQSHGRAYRAS